MVFLFFINIKIGGKTAFTLSKEQKSILMKLLRKVYIKMYHREKAQMRAKTTTKTHLKVVFTLDN